MNLYDKLKQEGKDAIAKDAQQYPMIAQNLINTLKSKRFTNQLELYDCTTLYYLVYPFKPFDLQLFNQLFNN
jgi:hypothetical protein